MNSIVRSISFASTLMLLSASVTIAAEPSELTRLNAAYEAEKKAALAPLQNRQIERLEQLLKTLTQRSDSDGALLVKKQIETLKGGSSGSPDTSSPATSAGAEALRAALFKTAWTWERSDKSPVKVVFDPDGRLIVSWGDGYRWKITGENTVEMTNPGLSSGVAEIKFNKELNKFTGHGLGNSVPVWGSPFDPKKEDSAKGLFGTPQ